MRANGQFSRTAQSVGGLVLQCRSRAVHLLSQQIDLCREAKYRSLSHFITQVYEVAHIFSIRLPPSITLLKEWARCCCYSCRFGTVSVSGNGVGPLSSGVVVLSSGAAMQSPAQSLVPLTVPTSLQPIGAIGFT